MASTSWTRGPWYTVRRVRGWVVVWVILPVATPMRTARPRKATELGVTCKAGREVWTFEVDAVECRILSSTSVARRGKRLETDRPNQHQPTRCHEHKA